MPQSIFVSCPDHFRGTGKAQESRHSPFKKKKKSSLEHLTLYSHCQFSFIHLQIFFFFTWKGDTKIWLCTGGGRRLHFSSLSVRFGNFFFCRLPSRSHPPVENCAPIPKMVPHSLNEQKCIGEWVRGRVRALKSVRGEARRPPQPPAALGSLEGSAALQLRSPQKKTKNKKKQRSHSFA